jgi:hypothetical protein
VAEPAFRFDARLPYAEAAAEEYAARFITRISESTREAIKAVIQRQVRGEITSSQAEKLIRQVIGLTAPQAIAVMNLRERLEKGGLIGPALDKTVLRYAEKQLRARAEMIARTEVMSALNAGAVEGYRQAQAAGYVPANAVVEWKAAMKAIPPPCQYCQDLDGTQVPVGAAFDIGRESAPGKGWSVTALLAPPRHQNCRCVTILVIPDSELPTHKTKDPDLDRLLREGLDR